MSRFEIVQHAGENETFTPHAFDQSIGKTIPVKVEGGESGEAELVAAVVAEDGRSVRLTFDTLVYHVEMEVQHTDQHRATLLESEAAKAGLCPRCLHTAHDDVGECKVCYCRSLKP